MKEIEVKILEIDPVEVVKKIKDLGAKKVEAGIVESVAFDFPDGRLVKEGSVLRLRKIGGTSLLTFKQKISTDGYKIMEETETSIGDYEKAARVFSALGMKAYALWQKYRATYKIGNTKFELDKFPGIPWFIEIEAPTKEEVKKGAEALGFSMEDAFTGYIFNRYKMGDTITLSEKESDGYDSLFG
jgi:adenylate cyclase class 2